MSSIFLPFRTLSGFACGPIARPGGSTSHPCSSPSGIPTLERTGTFPGAQEPQYRTRFRDLSGFTDIVRGQTPLGGRLNSTLGLAGSERGFMGGPAETRLGSAIRRGIRG